MNVVAHWNALERMGAAADVRADCSTKGERGFSWPRVLAIAVTIGLHGFTLIWISRPPAPDLTQPLWVVDGTAAPEEAVSYRPISSPPDTIPPRRSVPTSARAAVASPGRVRERPIETSLAPTPVPRNPFDMPVLDAQGRPRLSEHLLAEMVVGPSNNADFLKPTDRSQRRIFDRPPPIEYQETSFDRVWQPQEGLLDEWTQRLGKIITSEISLPLNPRFALVCQVTITGLGACRIQRNTGTQVLVDRPPPPPWERAQRVQCRELRDELARAQTTQEAVSTLDRLQALCVGGERHDP